jgi:hypothetical protein
LKRRLSGLGLERAAGVLFLVAASAHGLLAPAHFAVADVYGLGFVFAATWQAVWGLALATHAVNERDAGRWHRPLAMGLYATGIAGNLALLSFYVWTRTQGIPFGPERGEVEEVAVVDVATKVAEAAGALVLAVLLLRLTRGPQAQPP